MRFRVPCIGDAHLRNDARQPDRLAAIDQIIRECAAPRDMAPDVALWVVAGDLHDAGSDVETRNAWARRLRAMAAVAPVLICYGNHDRDGDLDIYGMLEAPHQIWVIDRPQVIDISDIRVFVVPYPNPAGLVADGVAPSQTVEVARTLLDAHFMAAGVKFDEARRAGKPTLFVGHANYAGCRTSTGQPLIGQEIELDGAMLARLGDCPKILNHIHLPQEVGDGVGRAWQVGSICRLSFGETEEKRYVTVDYVPASMPPLLMQGAPPWAWEVVSHPLVVAPMVLVEAVYADGAFTYDVDPSTIPPGADVRVRVRFPQSERQFFEFGRPALQGVFATARRLQIEPVALQDRGLRDPEVAQAKTTPEKLRAWLKVNGEPVPDGLDDAVAALETQDSDQVIAACKARMTALQVTRTPELVET